LTGVGVKFFVRRICFLYHFESVKFFCDRPVLFGRDVSGLEENRLDSVYQSVYTDILKEIISSPTRDAACD
jgi:hypothetical protein